MYLLQNNLSYLGKEVYFKESLIIKTESGYLAAD